MKSTFPKHETISLEYKEAADALPKSFFETVCAFLNRDGGEIVLGIADNGKVTGINPAAVEKIKSDISNLSNNPQKIFPPYLLFPHTEYVGDKPVIRVRVPCSSQVHTVGGVVFLRSEDGDYRLKDPHQIAGLVNRKLSFYTEQRVIPWLGMSDLSPALFDRARTLFRMHNRNHPWLEQDNEGLLRTGGFIRKDPLSSETGYTLAAALMFGTDTTIQQVAPGMSFDALLRRRNVDRYDDRILSHTNLIETFDILTAFCEKHLDDPFFIEGSERVNLRDRIFRELISNLIAHREYTSAAPASLTIFKDKVVFKNPHVPHISGKLDPAHFTPFPKNPTICNFMLQMGRYEQAGSGVYNVTKYLPHYTPYATPIFEEFHDIFSITIPLPTTIDPFGGSYTKETGEPYLVETETKKPFTYPKATVARKSPHEPLRELRSESWLESRPKSRLQSWPKSWPESWPESWPQTLTNKIIALAFFGEISRSELARRLGVNPKTNSLGQALNQLKNGGFIEYTLPAKPTSHLQKYRLTEKSKNLLQSSQQPDAAIEKPKSWPESWPKSRLQSWPKSWLESWPKSWPQTLPTKIISLVFILELSCAELARMLEISARPNSLKLALTQLRKAGMVDYTVPEKPSSRLQKYRITEKGREFLKNLPSPEKQ